MMMKLLMMALMVAVAARAEVKPPTTRPCFPGAYYRKAVSSVDVWRGIEGTVVLPIFTPDRERFDPGRGRNLDNPSIYIGGRAGDQEIDAGVTWEVIQEPDGSISKERKAFRPFWRNKKWSAGPAHPDYYFYPGDTIRLRITTPEKHKLTLEIELIERGELGKRETEKLSPTTRLVQPLSVTFDAPDFGPGEQQEFKRVNAIDQVANEGKPVQLSRAKVLGAKWVKVSLLRSGEGSVPMNKPRFTDMRCPAADDFSVSDADPASGAESIDIHPGE